MRPIVSVLVFVLAAASPSWAAQRTQQVTVAQFGEWLAGAHGQADGKMAKEVETKVLTERVSAAQLAQWQSTLPGRRSRDALIAIADVSMLLPLPQSSILPDPPPDAKTQSELFAHAIDYVVRTVTKLPDFYATGTTGHFEDNPAHQETEYGQGSTYGPPSPGLNRSVAATLNNLKVSEQVFAYNPLHLTGESRFRVSYRDGVEMHGAEKMDRDAINRPESSLTAAGEFGPILSVVLNDALHGSVDWGYWEQSPLGKTAVFRYTVPEGHSSYVVALRHGAREERLFPAYHGEIAIDSGTGAILRITLVASSLRSQDVMESAIEVDYGSVALGGKNYICPLKGIALLRTVVDTGAGTGLKTQVNDTVFTDYHLMRGDITILPASRH